MASWSLAGLSPSIRISIMVALCSPGLEQPLRRSYHVFTLIQEFPQRAEDVAQGYSACLTCTRSWVQPLAPKTNIHTSVSSKNSSTSWGLGFPGFLSLSVAYQSEGDCRDQAPGLLMDTRGQVSCQQATGQDSVWSRTQSRARDTQHRARGLGSGSKCRFSHHRLCDFG